MLELVAKPNGHRLDRWEPPPIFQSEQNLKPYEFDIRPDCAYWLSLQAFNVEYASRVSQWAFVINRRITCLYLFIEFKKDDKILRQPKTRSLQLSHLLSTTGSNYAWRAWIMPRQHSSTSILEI